MSEPTSSAAFGALFAKYGVFVVFAVIGAAVMAAFDPPSTKAELFKRALAAFVGSLFFGGSAVQVVSNWLSVPAFFDLSMSVHFLVGALSWFGFSALARFGALLKERGGDAAASHILKDSE